MKRFLLLAVASFAIGCSEQSAEQSGKFSSATTPVIFNTAGGPTVRFSAPDMMCPEGCGEKVKEILSEQPGAKDVIVDFDSKTATVATDGNGKFDANAAVAALVDHGFKNSSVKSDSTTTAKAKQQVSDSDLAP